MMKRAFTLIELLVVIGMITVLTGSISSSVASARARARVMKATAEVKEMTNAILAYENYERGNSFELPTLNRVDCDDSSLGFLVGNGGNAQSGGKIPVLLQAALTKGGKMLDPWGTPYKVTIKKGSATLQLKTMTGALNTGYYLPNFYRISEEER